MARHELLTMICSVITFILPSTLALIRAIAARMTGWSCTLVDDSGISVVGKFSTIEVLDSARDMVGIAYYDETNGTIRYAEAS